MEMTKSDINGVVVLDIDGEIDLYEAPGLKETIEEYIDTGQSQFLIDMDKVGYIDSSGIGALISILSKLKNMGGSLKLCNVAGSVIKVFKLTRLDAFFTIFDSRDEALESF